MSSDSNLPAYRTLLVAVDRGVATITLNRPRHRNAIGDGMRDELADAYRHPARVLRRRRPRRR
jgi:enoyl-CoA hydratase/carnithine racemase